jgi:hypothetical protein
MSTIRVGRFLPESENDKILEYVVKATFPRLNPEQQHVLHRYMLMLIQYIATCYDFYSNPEAFKIKLEQNLYKDCRWLLTYLIPYIDTDIKGFDDLEDLNQLYSLEYNVKNVRDLPESVQRLVSSDEQRFDLDPISFKAPRYVFSNTQYARFDKSGGAYKPVSFDYSHIEQNFKLLLGTIKETRYKLHVNWIDIIPVRMDNFKESSLYLETINKLENDSSKLEEWDPITDYPIENYDSPIVINSFNEKVTGLNIEDIYNTISIDLYESIVQYKWLIFDALILIDGKRELVPVFYILNAIFPTKRMLDGTKYILTTDETKDIYEENYRAVMSAYENSQPLSMTIGGTSVAIPSGSVDTVIEGMVMFFDQKYSSTTKKESSYIPLPKSIQREDLTDYEQDRSYSKDDVKKTLKSMSMIAIYDFMVEVLNGFKNTWYSTRLLDGDKMSISKDEESDYNFGKHGDSYLDVVTYKNVYNFCKSLVHHRIKSKILKINDLKGKHTTELYERYPRFWSELDDDAKAEFTKRINGEYADHKEWFNIYWNLVRPLIAVDPSYSPSGAGTGEYLRKMESIYTHMRGQIVDIVFESMICRGTMTQMISNPEFTNAALYDMSNSSQKKALVSRISNAYFKNDSPYMTEAYYYLTNKTYVKTTPFKIKENDKIEEIDYMKAMSNTSLAPYLATTYHWVAQVGFCHKFINNRVNYITGATGAGKSTEIPKLYLYFLKSIDRIDNATVVITVPRKNAAEDVSKYISKQMALPYDIIDEDGEEVRSNNYTVQFKHSGKKHIKNGLFPKIRFVTDGSVLLDVQNPLLRSVQVNKKGNNVYGRTDMYHVILVDEAHEHNANMDLILSMAKNTAFYNNRFRLGIVSATMAEDEPVYRRFYRDINDNRKYPLSSWIAKHSLDRINTERRFHISPPDVGTRFRIDEHYEPGGNPIDIVKKIVSNTSDGEILVFQPGSAEITAMVKELNEDNAMPADVIAIPYFARMSADRQDLVKGIHKQLSNLRLDKKADFTKVNPLEGTENYRRAVIVSTNISEASITYPSLVYVVETGVEKTAIFDYRTRNVVISSNYITEASRLQRKGRVGRSAPGEVYYTYEEGSMELNRKQFNISTQDSHLSIYLAQLKDSTDLPVFTPLVADIVSGRYSLTHGNEGGVEIDIDIDTLKTQIFESYKAQSKDYDMEFVQSVVEVIEELYTANRVYYQYVGANYAETTFSKLDISHDYPYPVYFSGYDVEQLTDNRGKFYIVHPDELSIDRNINGDIVYSDSDIIELYTLNSQNIVYTQIPDLQKQIMKSNKIKAFWSTLVDARLADIANDTIVKTPLGAIVDYGLSKLIDIQEKLFLAKMAILAYGLSKNDQEFDLLLSAICYLVASDGKQLGMFVADPSLKLYYKRLAEQRGKPMNPSKKDILEKTKAVFKPNKKVGYSDISIVLLVVELIDSVLNTDTGYEEGNAGFESTVDKFKLEAKTDPRKTSLLSIVDGLSDDTGYDDDALDYRDEILAELQEGYTNTQINNLQKNVRILNDLGIELKTCMYYIKLRERIRQVFRDMVIGVDDFKRRTAIEGFESFDDIRKIMAPMREKMQEYSVDLVRASLLLTLPYSVARKIDSTKYHYISVYSPDLTTMYAIGSTSRNYYHPNTYVDLEAVQEYVHYLESNSDLKTMECLTQIKSSDLGIIADIYSSLVAGQIGDSRYSIDASNEAIEKYTKERRDKRYSLIDIPPPIDESDEFNAINHAKATVDRIERDLRDLVKVTGHEHTDRLTELENIIWS